MSAQINAVIQQYVPFTVYPLQKESTAKCPSDHRLAEINWRFTEKQKAEGKKQRPPVCVAVPLLSIEVRPECFKLALQEALEDLQDSVIASHLNGLIEANSAINLVGQSIPSAIGNPDGLASVLAEDRAKGRLTGDLIKSYFSDHIMEPLMGALVEKNPSLEEKEAQQAVNRYMAALVSLASPRTNMPPKNALAMLKVVNMGTDSRIKRALIEKLDAFANPKKEAELLDLL